MKKATSRLSTLMVISLMFLYSCNSTDTVINGNWTRSSDFGGSTRSGAFQFTIGDSTYVGLGFGGKNGNQYLLDSYSFSLAHPFWNKKIAPFPGKGRELMVSFALKGKGYVGTGFNRFEDPDFVSYSDFWEYDPSLNTWTQLNDFPADSRYSAVAFASETTGHAYVGSGYNGDYFDDFYKYSPDDDSWKQIATPPSPKRRGAMVMNISGKFYYFGGESNGINNTDFLEFDPATEIWTPKTKISTDANFGDFTAAVRRAYASTLTLTIESNEFGYVINGSIGGSPTTITYQYDPTQDLWTKMTSFEGGSRYQAVSFVLTDATGPRAFVGTGTNGTQRLDDVWEWKPTQTYDANN